MILRLTSNVTIENLRRYPSEFVERLRSLLREGARASADPKRRGFYDLEDDGRVFYIHISPVSGRVMLLATWVDEGVEMAASQQPDQLQCLCAHA